VPHTHEVTEHAGELASRAHVHLTWSGSGHDHGSSHSHYDADPTRHETVPVHGDDVVYVDGSLEWIAPPKGDGFEFDRSLEWIAAPVSDTMHSIVACSLRFGRHRPPGDGAAATQTLLPHVLRI